MSAELFPPGEFLKDEMEERNWTQDDLANVLGISVRSVHEIVNAKRSITPQTASALGQAFGTSADYWLRLENGWQLFQLKQRDNAVARRANLYTRFPVKEMIRRGWIEESSSLDVLEKRFCDFFEVRAVDETPRFAAAFRRSSNSGADEEISPLQLAWLYRAFGLAKKVVPEGRFSEKSLDICFSKLRDLLTEPEETRHIAKILSEAGIRFIVVEPFSRSKVDGVCFWLDKNSPVVVLSLRLGRIDNFWFTLIHELRHVANKDGQDEPIIDEDIMGEPSLLDVEIRANEEAAEYLIPKSKVDSFIARVDPVFSFKNITGFALINEVHPGIVVGRLQKLGIIPWTHFRKLLVDIRGFVTQSTITDGWGYAPV